MTKPSDDQRRQALRESTAHWERLAEKPPFDLVTSIDTPGGGQCALCKVYAPDDSRKSYFVRCHGCPVAEHTGAYDCRNTPYYDADDAWRRGNKKEWEKHSAAMRDLLIEILSKVT